MTMITRNLREDITHWPVIGSNGYGGFTFDTPVVLKGRWEDKNELFRTLDNEEEVSNAIVYLNTDVAVGDFLVRGDETAESDPTSVSGTFRARNYNKTTNLRNVMALRKVFL